MAKSVKFKLGSLYRCIVEYIGRGKDSYFPGKESVIITENELLLCIDIKKIWCSFFQKDAVAVLFYVPSQQSFFILDDDVEWAAEQLKKVE